MLIPALLALVPQPQDLGLEPVPPAPYDRIVELEITEDSLEIDGLGRGEVYEYEVEFNGTLHVWTKSERDLVIRVEDINEGTSVEDDDSGGGDVPYLRLEVEEGDYFAVLVAGDVGMIGVLELHLVAAPETEGGRAAERAARRALQEASQLVVGGQVTKAREIMANALPDAMCSIGENHPDLLRAQWRLANSMLQVGDLAGARVLYGLVLSADERTLPEDHPDVLRSRGNLAGVMHEMGDLAGARALHESVLEARERTLPNDHRDLLRARSALAVSMDQMGEPAEARAMRESVLAAYERTLPEDHPDLLLARLNLAVSVREMGEFHAARSLCESVLATYDRTDSEDHLNRARAQLHLARVMQDIGDHAGARALYESVLATYESSLPEDHPDLLRVRVDLANSTHEMGDIAGGRALDESVLEAYERMLPEGHPHLLAARANLAVSIDAMGDVAGARALHEAVVAGYELTLPEDHHDLLLARLNLAGSLHQMGNLAEAHALYESVHEAYERTLPEDNPDVLRARSGLAGSMGAMGNFDGSRALYESIVAAYERTLSVDHHELLRARADLAGAMYDMGDLGGTRALLPKLVTGMRERVLSSLALAPRQAREAVGAEASRLEQVLLWSRSGHRSLKRSVFALQETMRMVACEVERALRSADDPDIQTLLIEAGAARRALSELAGDLGECDEVRRSDTLARLIRDRDRLEREASRMWAERGVVTQPIEVDRLVENLREEEAILAYRRMSARLLAHVLEPDGELTVIDIGEVSELEKLVRRWRQAEGRAIQGRGVGTTRTSPSADGRGVGKALCEVLVGPLLEALDEKATKLHVCADDLVHLVPLDALPYEDGVLGDRYRIVNEISCARMMKGAEPEAIDPSLLLVGGIEYDAESEGPDVISAAAEVDLRSGFAAFSYLPGTRAEVDSLRTRFEYSFDAEAELLVGAEATKAALAASVAGKRWVHIATHGWFAPESVKSILDPEPGETGWSRVSIEERVTGMAPMLLCGLALSGANAGRDSLGRMRGILTAEEMATLDLSNCELAVLSACETNVGIRRAGQGIQSLQAALHAAGARTAITSLWKVDDAATRKLFELFYTYLWVEKMGKAEALWKAKMDLRDAGHPLRDWAGWVLTGDPD